MKIDYNVVFLTTFGSTSFIESRYHKCKFMFWIEKPIEMVLMCSLIKIRGWNEAHVMQKNAPNKYCPVESNVKGIISFRLTM